MRSIESGGDYGLGEDQVAETAPYVRALLVQRLEQVWSTCEPHVTGQCKPDPRFVEAGIRVLDRLAKLFRLDQPVSGSLEPAAQDPEALRKEIRAAVAQLEARQGSE